MTTGPSLGPASAYPTLSRPASICFSDANDVLAPGLIARMPPSFVLLGCASAEPFKSSWAAATVTAAVPRKLRRYWLISSDFSVLSIGVSPRGFARDGGNAAKEAPHLSNDQSDDRPAVNLQRQPFQRGYGPARTGT